MTRSRKAITSLLSQCTCQSPANSRPAFLARSIASESSKLPAKSNPLDPQSLADFHPFYDIHPSKEEIVRNKKGQETAKIVIINDPSPFKQYKARKRFDEDSGSEGAPTPASASGEMDAITALTAQTQFTAAEIREFHRYPLVRHRVASMTAKGKQAKMYALVVSGNGKGLLGVGEGKHENIQKAIDKAFVQSVKNMAYVERFEGRTIWGDLKDKFCATEVSMWARPPGFGLRCSPMIHQVAKAAGITDLSAKIRRSKNQMNTVKLAVRMLQGRHYPLGLGDGFGGRAPAGVKGKGNEMRTADEIAVSLGRRAITL